jgi:hypothetical protein
MRPDTVSGRDGVAAERHRGSRLRALGLMGPGPLSQTSVTSEVGAIRVEYERFLRRGATTTVRIHAKLTDRETAMIAVWLARPYLEAMTIGSMQPPPARTEASPDRVTWSFEATSRDSRAPLLVTIRLTPEAIGRLRAAVGLGPRSGLGFNQWIYP